MVRDSGDLRIFVDLLSMLDDHPDDRASLEAQIATEAQALYFLVRADRRVLALQRSQVETSTSKDRGPP